MSDNIYGGEYEGPKYEFSQSVIDLRRLPRFGYSKDITLLFSSNQEEQASYAAGLIALFVFLLVFFIFWTLTILVFKIMGPGNAGFLSGHHFVVPDPAEDVKNIGKRPFRVRLVFLISAGLLMTYSVLFVTMGLTNVDNTANTMTQSLKQTGKLIINAELIAKSLEEVGNNSVEIRDSAVEQLDNFCPQNPQIGDMTGVDVMAIANQAKADLTMLSNFIKDGLATLNEALARARVFANNVDNTIAEVQFWGWQMKLLSAGLFVLPSFLVMGVGLVMLDLDLPNYQKFLSYFVMPCFVFVTIIVYIVCAAILPISATNADACTGGGRVHGGPDDTLLTIWRHLRGNDTGIVFQIAAYYTQRCNPKYYPYGFLSKYLNDLDEAITSTGTIAQAVQDNLGLLEAQCGRSFDEVVPVVKDMSDNLKILRDNADMTLDLIKCKNINDLYVNTMHDAACKYSVSALAWIFASALIIAVCGLIMIMLRSAYYPVENLELSDSWIKAPKSASGSNSSPTQPSTEFEENPTSPTHSNKTAPVTPQVDDNNQNEFDFEVDDKPSDEF